MQYSMLSLFVPWAKLNYFEIAGMITGFIYIYFQIRENILLWPFGIITSAFYIYVFFVSKIYADMALNGYYLIISVYGWVYWKKGREHSNQDKLPIASLKSRLALILLLVSVFLFTVIAYILKNYTDSPVPLIDSFTTSLSIVATWMLARKILQHWLLWIIIDVTSFALYIYRGLFATTILFLVYTVLAILGYLAWKKEYRLQHA